MSYIRQGYSQDIQRGGWYAEKYDPLKAGSIDSTGQEPHDHAIKRAMTNRRPSGYDNVLTDPKKTLFIGALSTLITSENLKDSLSHYGEIEEVIVIRDKVTGESRRYGFVTFKDQQSAMELFRASRKHTISIVFRRHGSKTSKSEYKNISQDSSQSKESGEIGADQSLDSTAVLVDFERSRVMKGWIPRRLGGGIGGKKESGQLRFGGGIKPFRFPTR
ncbi:small nuclear ribonucleoprotein 35kDa (U11 U12) [Entomortierella beljakovae]|nr:small nuclear ribonucleoprotein 35kDa (U11 U12) [Entomortierella beljakovae]